MRYPIGLCALLGCSPEMVPSTGQDVIESAPSVRLRFQHLPAATSSIEVLAFLDHVPARETPLRRDVPPGVVAAGEAHLQLQLPLGARGLLVAGAGARDRDGCLIAAAGGGLQVAGSGEGELVLSLEPSAIPKDRCQGDGPLLAAAPTITVPTAGGTELTLRGWGLAPRSAITIGGSPAEIIEWRSPVEAIVRVPARKGRPGPAEVAVRSPDERSDQRGDLLRYQLTRVQFADPAPSLLLDKQVEWTVSADVDADGWPDLIASHFDLTSGAITVMRNVGGTFPADKIQSYPADKTASALAAGDLDGDGYPDIVVGARYGDTAMHTTVRVLWNRGDGTFPTDGGAPLTVGEGPTWVAIADVSGDGKPDIVTANHLAGPMADGTVAVLLNQEKRAFSLDEYPYQGRPVSLALADLDGDGQLDILTAGQIQPLCLRLNQGMGRFAPSCTAVPSPFAPFLVLAGDLDGDSRADLLLTQGAGLDPHVLLNQGGVRFADVPLREFDQNGLWLALADMDLDGNLDIAAALAGDRGLVRLNDGGGAFSPPRLIQANAPSPGQGPYRLPVADFDRDGLPDLAVAGKDRRMSILFNRSE